jgi:hypothetical protein
MAEIKELIIKTREQVKEFDEEYPDYADNYFEKYRAARLEAGLEETSEESEQNFMKYMVEDVELDF